MPELNSQPVFNETAADAERRKQMAQVGKEVIHVPLFNRTTR